MTTDAQLRDNVAGRLILRKGQTGYLRETTAGGTYDPATGRTSAATTQDTAFAYVDLPMTSGRMKSLFREDLISQIEKLLLISMKELAAASKTLGAESVLVLGGIVYRVVALAPVSPAGTQILVKAGVTKG